MGLWPSLKDELRLFQHTGKERQGCEYWCLGHDISTAGPWQPGRDAGSIPDVVGSLEQPVSQTGGFPGPPIMSPLCL